MKDLGKVLYRGKARFGVFGERPQDHVLQFCWDRRPFLMPRRGWHGQVLDQHLDERPFEGACSAEPFIDHHSERVLVAGCTGMPFDLLGCHVAGGSCLTVRRERVQTLLDHGKAKITEHDFIVGGEQYIFRFDITVDDTLLVGIV